MDLESLPLTTDINLYDKFLIEATGRVFKSYTFGARSIYSLSDLPLNDFLRRNIYRGSKLGSAVTDEQWEEIRNGTFRNMFIGDYWSIGGYNWQICDFDYYLYTGADSPVSAKHLLIMPTMPLYAAKYHEGSLTNGYFGSDIRTTGLNNARAIIQSAFGSDHIMSFPIYITNSSNSSGETGSIWTTGSIELPTADMLGLTYPDWLESSTDYLPLAITNLSPRSARYSMKTYWTRNFIKNNKVIIQWRSGTSSMASCDQTDIWVRPVFAII